MMASENSWGYTRIQGALKNLGHESDETRSLAELAYAHRHAPQPA